MVLDELKNFVLLHSKVLGVYDETRNLLSRIDHLGDDLHSSWSRTFFEAALACEKKGECVKACALYNLSRFPYAETELQQACYEHCLRLFKHLYIDKGIVTRVSLSDDKQICYIRKKKSNNVIIISGGIISLKEQWVNIINLFDKFDFTIVLAEMPGVGENKLPYGDKSFSMYSDILDYLGSEQGTCHCHIIGLSFSGFIAYKNSIIDSRISGLTMVGTPFDTLYHDADVYNKLPYVTRLVIEHNIINTIPKVTDAAQVFNYLDSTFTIDASEVNNNVKLYYVQSLMDEVIPNVEAGFIKKISRHHNILSLRDVHGSPHYNKTVKVYILWSILDSFRISPLFRLVTKCGIRILRFLKK
ncbi:hypothetical protein PCO86_13745 [Pectobacteriaceae bacterium CE70]|uniref:Alpha/beta hydrolase n=1 Tax=Serratia sp. (strain ATCC 39006) TaxID=104623 RepID=A0A2I5TLS8_SERS3|nr:hypothetical protein [Serratia sp. ATCC 39006]WJV64191.1 hypothetical protein PCO87_09300 [Pectobacteriaceae bacterium C52]WJV65379.1 hypothetical protein PCO86_13745 [Pectobacteriaceae bacterium CE70]WJY09395.1 hypothetical protein PCO80_13635 [Pectobacteriaceae bacterium C80]AUH01197.1 hypothetical protein CWC46_16075 [Serratia sp. ATCC 39006]AUH05517.1 hypothetical protein Ser39006_016075 [Serratia sp. ATCC 39006]